MRRELLSVRTEAVLGAVIVSVDGAVTYEGGAEEVLSRVVQRLGDKAGEALMTDGWSNGYLYLGRMQP